MALFYRTSERAVEHQKRARDLKQKDQEREKKLVDIERKFKDVKASSENLAAELRSSLKSMEEGTETTKVIVGQFEEAQAKIRALEADKASFEVDKASLEVKNSTLAAEKEVLAAAKASLEERLLDVHERSTLKARYEVLKQHKQGSLVDAEVDDEIEMYETLIEPENPSSTPNIEPPVQANVEVQPSARASGEAEPAVQEEVTQDRNVRE